MGRKFNQPIDNLPNSLIILKISNSFNQLINNLPNSLEKLEYDSWFNNPIEKLPLKLKYLNLMNSKFNSDIIWNESNNLIEKLILSSSYDKKIPYLPNIKNITIKNLNQYELFDERNTNLIKRLNLYKNDSLKEIYNQIPKSIEELIITINKNFNWKYIPIHIKKITFLSSLLLNPLIIDNNISQNIESIEFGKILIFGIKIKSLPKTIKEIIIYSDIQKEFIPNRFNHLIKFINKDIENLDDLSIL